MLASEFLDQMKAQEEAKNKANFMAELIAEGRRLGDKPEPEPEATPDKSQNANLVKEIIAAGLEAQQMSNGGYPVQKKADGRNWTDEMKKKACPRNGGHCYGILVGLTGVERIGMHCNLCEGCFKHNAAQLKEKMGYNQEKGKYELEIKGKTGHWRRAIVEDDNEAKALKKKISRTQDSRHVEFAAEAPGHNEVWTYIEDDTDQPERFGDPADIEDIDFNKVYKQNRGSGKKFSTGKGLKKSAAPQKQDDQEKIRMILPEIIVTGGSEAADKAEQIAVETHFCKEAETPEEAVELFAYQVKFIVQEMEKEGIEVAAVNYHFRNYSPDYILEKWNETTRYWMSINAPLDSSYNGAKVDIANRLHYPVNKKEAHKEPLN